jgi:hypothetical protein
MEENICKSSNNATHTEYTKNYCKSTIKRQPKILNGQGI